MKINKDDLTNASKKELNHFAKKASIKRYTKMSREELVASLSCFISDTQDQDSIVSSESSFSESRSIEHFYGQPQDEVSLSKFVSDYFKSVSSKQTQEHAVSPVLSEISGILLSKSENKKLLKSYKKHIEEKYR